MPRLFSTPFGFFCGWAVVSGRFGVWANHSTYPHRSPRQQVLWVNTGGFTRFEHKQVGWFSTTILRLFSGVIASLYPLCTGLTNKTTIHI